MEKDILEELMPFVSERLGRVFQRSEDYKQTIEKENEIYEQLREGLTIPQENQLTEYFMAVKVTEGIGEKLAYKQGIKDVISICASAICKEDKGKK